jgi:hypothetical protein
MIRTVKECYDMVYDMRKKSPQSMHSKVFEVHIWITSAPEETKEPDVVVDDEIAFWGRPRKPDRGVEKAPTQYTELELYKKMMAPPKGKPAQLGDIYVYNGRPKWDDLFSRIAQRAPAQNIGVAFCGNPRIGDDLRDMCFKHSSIETGTFFNLHKENF